MEVKVIPARKRQQIRRKEETPKTRVAAYCRVSTDMEEQESSYEAQVLHYENYIRDHPGYVSAGIFADEGISGTGTKKRSEFNRMIDACMAGKVDLVITKSISRFARNTLDCLQYIRQLKAKNIPIYFEKEQINTLDAKGEVLITILASLAQQESQSISQNVRLGIQYQFQQGKVRLNHTWFYGYTKDENGKLVIVPEEAKIVKRIFYEYIEGKSARAIAKEMMNEGILTAAGGTKWYESTIVSMLKNEKYMGDVILQKYYTVDFLTKKREKNTGALPQYYVENDHEPIISREMFLRVQGEMQRRTNTIRENGQMSHYSGKFACSGRLICSHCNTAYRRMKHRHGVDWRCKTRTTGCECEGRAFKEETLHAILLKALNKLLFDAYLLKERIDYLNHSLLPETEAKIKETEREIAALQNDITQLSRKMPVQYSEEDIKLTEAINALDNAKKKKQELLAERAKYDFELMQHRQVVEYGRHTSKPVKVYNEEILFKLLDKAIVYDDHVEVIFKAGLRYDIE